MTMPLSGRDLLPLASRTSPCNTGLGNLRSPVHTLGEHSAHPHTTAVGMVYQYLASGPTPLKFDGARTTAQRLPPRLGELTREVLKESGYSEAQILGLEEMGVARSASVAEHS